MSKRHVLVTGAGGFIGSHLTEALLAAGHDVRALCHYDARGTWGWLDRASKDTRKAIDVRLGDVRDARFIEDSVAGVEIVLHLAALIAIPYSYVAAESFVDTNVRGTLNLLEAAKKAGVTRFVQTSSSEVYGTPSTLPIRETHALNAQSPYAASKIAADQLALAYHKSFGVPVVVLRPFNTFGPRQSTRAILPSLLVQLLAGQKTIAVGRTDTKRDLLFVDDTVSGFIAAAFAEASLDGATVQLGTGKSVSIAELFATCCEVTGRQATLQSEARRMRPDASEVLVLEADASLAKERLGWTPRIALEDGIRRTATWLSAHQADYDAELFHV